MKLFLIILYFATLLVADSSIFSKEDDSVGCRVVFNTKKESNCDRKEVKKITIEPIKIPDKKAIKIKKLENELKAMKEEFAKYKKAKDSELKEVYAKLDSISKQFIRYKIDKEKKIKKIKTQLNIVKKELSKNRKKLATLKKTIKKRNKRVKKVKVVAKKKSKDIKKERLKKSKKIKKVVKKAKPIIVEKKEPKRASLPPNTPWVEIVVEDGLDIYELALKYYKDKREYKQIYLANRDIIGKNLRIRDGMSLKIPITEKFEEQPMFINRN